MQNIMHKQFPLRNLSAISYSLAILDNYVINPTITIFAPITLPVPGRDSHFEMLGDSTYSLNNIRAPKNNSCDISHVITNVEVVA